MFEKTRSELAEIGLPAGDDYTLPDSTGSFSDGAHFRVEVATINSLNVAQELLAQAKQNNITINRITETYGLFRYTQSEIKQFVELTSEYETQLVMSIGPRASYDISASAKTTGGKSIAYRLRGEEQIIRAIEDVKRGIECGVKHFVVYDEGLLWALNEMRKAGSIAKDVSFKVSAHCGHGNPASIKLLQQIGADTINPVRDLELPMISALRQTVDMPLDIHTDNPTESGGFIRFYEVPEIIRIAAPVYLKVGNSAVEKHGEIIDIKTIAKILQNISVVLEIIKRYCPQFKQS